MSENPPLHGIRVIEFSHVVMGPSAGLVLADLGADVIKVEQLGEGDNTRRMVGSGAGFFPFYNRNKRSIMLDLKSTEGLAFAKRLIKGTDVLMENFRPGALEARGLGYETLKADNPGLIYCSLKGFLSGPYQNRAALDEVVQMMGGMAYMTGPPGKPTRAGASINDILGGVFGVVGVLAALHERKSTGLGQMVKSALFESNVFLMAQHMTQYVVTGTPAAPMPARLAAFAIYDVFATGDGQHAFIGVVTDTHWKSFCAEFDLPELYADPSLATNLLRVDSRDRLHAILRGLFLRFARDEIIRRCQKADLACAPIAKPEELFDDPHLAHPGAMMTVTLPDGRTCPVPALPLEMKGRRLGLRHDVPRAGQHSMAVARELGYEQSWIEELIQRGVLGVGAAN